MARKPQILVVYKKDAYQQYVLEQRDARLRKLLRQRHPDVLDMRRAHLVHEAALESVIETLRALPVDVELAYRLGLKVTKRYSLVVSVGGDGTFLQAARNARGTPILGVNSDPDRSEAVFCAATHRTFPSLCRRALAGRLSEILLYRLKLSLNGKRLPYRAVNDVLLAHDNPSTMSRYRVRLGARQEAQKSSAHFRFWIFNFRLQRRSGNRIVRSKIHNPKSKISSQDWIICQ